MAKRLVAIHAFWKGMDICVTDDDADLDTLLVALNEALVTYDNALAQFPDSAEFYARQLDGIQQSAKAGDPQAFQHCVLAMVNVHWLQQRGHLQADDQNGMMFVYAG